MTQHGHIVPQNWERGKLSPTLFNERLARNADADVEDLGGLLKVCVNGKQVALYDLQAEVLYYPPPNGKASAAPPLNNGAARRPTDGRPLCPRCSKPMRVKFGKFNKPFWGCQCRRGSRRFYPHPDDLVAAGNIWDVALAFSLERYTGEDYSHLWSDRYSREIIERRRRYQAQQVTERTIEALDLIHSERPSANGFRAAFWPDSPGSASYLPSLVERGFVCAVGDFYRLTFLGLQTLTHAKLNGVNYAIENGPGTITPGFGPGIGRQ